MLPAYFSSQVLQIFETKWGRLKNQITDKTECYRNYNHFNLSTHSLMPYWQRAIESIFPRVFITQFLPVWLTWWNYGLSAKKVINGKKKLVHNFSSFFSFLDFRVHKCRRSGDGTGKSIYVCLHPNVGSFDLGETLCHMFTSSIPNSHSHHS